MPFYYYAFGLNILSDIECPALLEGSLDSDPDLVIRIGSVPTELKRAKERGPGYQVGDDQLLLNVDKVARYLVSGGSEITIDPHQDAADLDIRLFLLGSTMGALLHQRGIWPLHGSAVTVQSGAALFVGERGAGKSTLAGALHQRGFQAVADDVCAITKAKDGSLQVWPAFPRFKLWTDSILKLGSTPAQLARSHSVFEKFEFPLHEFGRDPLTIRVIYALYAAHDQESVALLPLKGFDKIRELTSHTFRLHFLRDMQLMPRHFQMAQALARQARVVRVTRPSRPFLLDQLVNHIERDIVQ